MIYLTLPELLHVAVRTLGASAFGADAIVAHELTAALITERGEQDWESEMARMPRLFRGAETIPGLTWPDLTFSERLTVALGARRGTLELRYCGRGHTEGDIVAWLPSLKLEGGPDPWELVPDSQGFAALLAGFFASRAGLPPPPTAPRVREFQRRQAEVALPWAARELGLPPP